MTALLVEQEGSSRQRLAKIVERHGFEVRQCHSVSGVRAAFLRQDLVVLGHTIPARECGAVMYWLLSQPEAERPFILILQNGSGNATAIGQELVHQVSATMPAVESALERIRRRIELKRNAERNWRPVPQMERPEDENTVVLGGAQPTSFFFPSPPTAPPSAFVEEDLESLPPPWLTPPEPLAPLTFLPNPVEEPAAAFSGPDPLFASVEEEPGEETAPLAVATLVAPPPGAEPPPPRGPDGIGSSWESILQEVHGAVVILDAGQTIRFRNRACASLPEDGPVDTLEEWLDRVALSEQPIQAWLQDLWRDQIPRVIRCQGIGESSPRHLDFRSHLLPDGGLVVTILDISEMDEAERARRRIQGRFSALYGHSPLGLALVNVDGVFIGTNGIFHELTGISLAGAEPPQLDACLSPEALQSLGWPGPLKPGVRVQTLLRLRNGRALPARVWLAALEETDEIEDRAHTVLFVEDLRVETRLREELEASQWQNGALIQTLPDLLLLLKNDGTLRDWVAPPEHPLALESPPGSEVPVAQIFPALAPLLEQALAECRQRGAMVRRDFETTDRADKAQRFELRLAGAGVEDCVAMVRHLGPVPEEAPPEPVAEAEPEPEPAPLPTAAEAETTPEAPAALAAPETVPSEPPSVPMPMPEPVFVSPFTPAWERALFTSLPDGLLLADLRGRILQVNAALAAAVALPETQLAGKRLAFLYGGDTPQDFNRAVSEGLSRFRRWDGRVACRTPEGAEKAVWLSFVPLEPETGPKLILGVHRELPPEPEPEPVVAETPAPAAAPAPAEEPVPTEPAEPPNPLDRIALERQQHRHRNQLQTLGALLHLETSGDGGQAYPPTLARELRKQSWRLSAFARLQEIQPDEQGRIPLAPFIQALVNEIIRPTTEAALRVEVSSRYADAGLEDLGAAAFGLLTVEMLSRLREALDHRRDGRGRIEVALIKRAGEVFFELSGPPQPEASTLPALGQSLIARSLLRQVGGTLEEADAASGVLAYRIRFPLEPGIPG